MAIYIHQLKNWPNLQWEETEFISLLSEVRNFQGKLMGKVELLGFELKDEANLETLIQDVIQTSEIEGEILNPELVRSSIATRLGLEYSGLEHSDRHIDGIVELMLDATQNDNKILTDDRLFGWHAALFPTGRSGIHKIEVANWRSGDMQVVSGGMGREIVHYEAPKAQQLVLEMKQFINWYNDEQNLESLLKAAIAHLWFITIHPFDDGNGRIARAITDMQLSKSDGINQRFYSMSTEINKQKKSYYTILERTQKDNLDITEWIIWFLECLKNSILYSSVIVDKVVKKHHFWVKNTSKISNERQQIMLNKLMDNFEGNLNTSKWAKMAKTSPDTALRDITDLVNKGILIKADSGGRSTHYILKDAF
ncbi:cell filamentation protein Fic [Flavobacterium plurextorum]|uniref:Cell filamentation protein Fic n=1 Tax=Flavobacterium plurextorum TaxID=1114867 RepID=A0ABX4CUL8_9FLAO|nr:Fic family protein [Flavobacterium plurextorum]OXB08402.1 cell filamentation protein Fic [Flavobacterium plurextorum]